MVVGIYFIVVFVCLCVIFVVVVGCHNRQCSELTSEPEDKDQFCSGLRNYMRLQEITLGWPLASKYCYTISPALLILLVCVYLFYTCMCIYIENLKELTNF